MIQFTEQSPSDNILQTKTKGGATVMIKGKHRRDLCGDRTLLYLDCSGDYIYLLREKDTKLCPHIALISDSWFSYHTVIT